ncbi:MAG: hypothetical protein ACO3DT_00540 [Gammaproteobacteria bacterium]
MSTSDVVISACQRISGKLASVSFDECAGLNMQPSGHHSVEGFPLLIKEYPPLEPVHSRTNANLVDLNRNFTTPESHLGAPLAYWYGKAYKNERRYPGPYLLSEPETTWLYQEIESFKPDVIILVHAPYSLVDYDAPNRSNAPRRIGNLRKNLMGTYPGSLGNYAGIHLGIPVITLELPHAGIMPTKKQISWLWTDLVRWLIRKV